MNIGIIGLGLMGGSLGKTLIKKGEHKVFGYDLSEQVMLKADMLKAIDAPLTEETAKNIADKVSARGLSSLNAEETSQLAKILGVSPQELANLSKVQIKKLLVQFHPDKCKLDYAHEISTILTSLLRGAK